MEVNTALFSDSAMRSAEGSHGSHGSTYQPASEAFAAQLNMSRRPAVPLSMQSMDIMTETEGLLLHGGTGDFPCSTAEDLDRFPAFGAPLEEVMSAPLWKRLLWDGGGSPFDVFLTAASAQVGQVLLNLPNSMARLGLVGGILTQTFCAATAVYTLCLLQSLYHEVKRMQVKSGTWFSAGTFKRDHVTQYHSVIHDTMGSRWYAEFTRVVNVLELIGLAAAQIISSASNLYYAQPVGHRIWNKRDFTLLSGGIASCFVFVPLFRHMRVFVFIALFGSSYVAYYMIAESIQHGFPNAAATAAAQPTEFLDIFQAVSNILFTFGGHAMLIEVLDGQFRPSKFRGMFGWALVYVTAFLTLPSASLVYLSFPEEAYNTGNAFKIFPPDAAMVFGVAIMMLHQMIAYGLFMLPVFHIAEKALGVHEKGSYFAKVAARLLPAFVVWLITLMFPFFGVINDLIGSFCTPFETYITPCLAFTIYYWSKARRENPVDTYPGFSFGSLFIVNGVVIAAATICGLGFGGYASVVELATSVKDFGLFAPCYQC
ncbi:hypothetical protein CEUSTIGMA_g7349.t1 [Chlamydomonas eustigma]|uniref:Amino acid transporter transmembrane domain-containing protein n=1 Tax=Chlamydomonas eustigma TaxID=1157962 RepID=A0A250XAI6_9CHLO|nr:hypothetical protein CEUSTIGMA_g7349.t1 [Chlamydomonas eustigma]|eukprot:GAX79909.1 hypothetical protein CEUSTIGMA_g7349.t1 [Chlamydomonas eustigma]